MQPTTFACPICGLTFDEQKWAKECEAWCRAHASCSLTITAHSREVSHLANTWIQTSTNPANSGTRYSHSTDRDS